MTITVTTASLQCTSYTRLSPCRKWYGPPCDPYTARAPRAPSHTQGECLFFDHFMCAMFRYVSIVCYGLFHGSVRTSRVLELYTVLFLTCLLCIICIMKIQQVVWGSWVHINIFTWKARSRLRSQKRGETVFTWCVGLLVRITCVVALSSNISSCT